MGSRNGHLTHPAGPPDTVAAIVRSAWESAGLDPPPDLLALRRRPVAHIADGGRSAGTEESAPETWTAADVEIRSRPSDRPVGGHDPSGPEPAPSPISVAHQLGVAYELQLDAAARSAGAHYTPDDVAMELTRRVMGDVADPAGATVWDPACGGGAFLLAAAETLRLAGVDPHRIVDDLLWGTDTDPDAVAIAEASLVLWATLHGAPDARPRSHLAVADALVATLPPGAERFDQVLGNPPFQGQLAGSSVRSTSARSALRERWGDLVGAYTDTSTLFLAAGVEALAPGGRLGMILPTSVLSARDARPARAHVDLSCDMVGMWVATEPVFRAGVQVWAPILVKRRSSGAGSGTEQGAPTAEPTRSAPPVERWRRRSFEPLGQVVRGRRRWSDLGLAALDVPGPAFSSGAAMASVAEAASGFRDEYYGLVGHVTDLGPGDGWPAPQSGSRPLITSGTIDPGRCLWGERPVRFAKTVYARPVVDEATLEAASDDGDAIAARAAAWVRLTAGPKVVVATQTRVGEACVDEQGTWLPSTPTIVVRPVPTVDALEVADEGFGVPGETEVARLWALAAVICSPVGTVVAHADSFGSARSSQAIKPTAASVLDLPLPVDRDAWAHGAEALRLHDRDRFTSAMAEAYGVPDADREQLHHWWDSRAPW